jgi:CHAT domain-containing protein
MRDMKYLDFDLAIEPSGNGYTARVFNSPSGQAAAEFTTPFSDLEVENFLLRVGRTWHAVRRVESPEMASAKAFGAQLFNGVFTSEVRGCLPSSVDEASRQAAGLRLRLHLGKAPALADLPWEFLYNASMNRFLSLSIETPLVRYLDLQERIRPLAVKPPLRVLMMISSPTDYPSLDVDRESAKMSEALASLENRGLVIVERQEEATLSELRRRLRQGQYHIFHFIGHGGFDSQADDGILVLEDAEGRGRRVSAQFLGTLLHDHRPLRLAVLNACEGARSSRLDPFAGTAQSLVQQGIPAVIAMCTRRPPGIATACRRRPGARGDPRSGVHGRSVRLRIRFGVGAARPRQPAHRSQDACDAARGGWRRDVRDSGPARRCSQPGRERPDSGVPYAQPLRPGRHLHGRDTRRPEREGPSRRPQRRVRRDTAPQPAVRVVHAQSGRPESGSAAHRQLEREFHFGGHASVRVALSPARCVGDAVPRADAAGMGDLRVEGGRRAARARGLSLTCSALRNNRLLDARLTLA